MYYAGSSSHVPCEDWTFEHWTLSKRTWIPRCLRRHRWSYLMSETWIWQDTRGETWVSQKNLVGVALKVIDDGIKLDHAVYAKNIVIEEIGSFECHQWFHTTWPRDGSITQARNEGNDKTSYSLQRSRLQATSNFPVQATLEEPTTCSSLSPLYTRHRL